MAAFTDFSSLFAVDRSSSFVCKERTPASYSFFNSVSCSFTASSSFTESSFA